MSRSLLSPHPCSPEGHCEGTGWMVLGAIYPDTGGGAEGAAGNTGLSGPQGRPVGLLRLWCPGPCLWGDEIRSRGSHGEVQGCWVPAQEAVCTGKGRRSCFVVIRSLESHSDSKRLFGEVHPLAGCSRTKPDFCHVPGAGAREGVCGCTHFTPPRWDFGQLQPLVPWNQQTLSVCHSYRKGKPRSSPDHPQRLRCERERGWGLLRERLLPALQGRTQTSPATGEAAGGLGPPRLSQDV